MTEEIKPEPFRARPGISFMSPVSWEVLHNPMKMSCPLVLRMQCPSLPPNSIGAYGALISNSISMENDPGRIFYRLTMGPEERVTSHPELVHQQVSGSSLLMANYLSLILPVRVGPILLVW